MTLDDFLSRLKGVRRSGNKATALCPGHEDTNSSLSATEGDDDRILLKCFAGCTVEQIVAALGLQMSDLMGANGRKHRALATAPERVWTIRDAHGRAIAEHHRVDLRAGKKKMWWRRDGSNGLHGLPVADLPLYGSELVKDIPQGAEIYVTEGEKAADALRERGLFALGTVTGAKGMPGLGSLSVLRGRDVILWPDFDDVGRAHMNGIDALLGVAARVGFLLWGEQEGDDAADYFARGGTVEGLARLVAEERKPSAPPVPVLAALLGELVSLVHRFVVMTEAQAVAWALWVAHTHVLDAADETPYLSITSPEKRSGKTRVLEVSELVVARPWKTDRVSAAALVRKIDKVAPTLLLDESDAAFNGDEAYSEALRGILNAGHRRGGRASVCIGQGSAIDVHDFSAFCPKAIAGIGKLPGTVADRAIPIRLQRKERAEAVERFRARKARAGTSPLLARLGSWAAASIPALQGAEPELPDELSDRAQDGAEPLLAIAELAGGDWSKRARSALVELFTGDNPEDDSLGVRLLRDCRAVFEAHPNEDKLASADLRAALVDLEESPWSELHKGKPLTVRGLARLLNPYGIGSGTVRLGENTAKGYYRRSFEDTWSRYLPPPTGSPNVTPSQTNTGAGSDDFLKRHTKDVVTDEKRGILNTDRPCDGVTDESPPGGRVHENADDGEEALL